MLPLFISLVTTQQHYREADQLKTLLANGSIIYCENRKAPYVSVQLILSNRDTVDQPNSYGYRHLIEHIAARSIPGHDFEIETSGGFLFASTNRDWMRFEWRVPPDKIQFAYKGIDKLLKDCGATEGAIQRESVAIGREIALSSSGDVTSREAWREVYGDDGLDPLGTRVSTATAKPDDLSAIWRKLTRGGNVVISACGPLDKKSFTDSCRSLLSGLVTSKPAAFPSRSIGGSYSNRNTVALPIPPISTKANANALIAVFGLASRLNRPFVTYTMSDRFGLAIVGSTDPFESIKPVTTTEDPATIFNLGRLMALLWLQAKNSTPEGSAELNGTLLSLAPSLRPAKVAENLEYASFADFSKYWNQIKEVAQ